jgi:hypothetical protein
MKNRADIITRVYNFNNNIIFPFYGDLNNDIDLNILKEV